MLQGVRDVFELVELEQASSSEKAKTGKIVFIGRGIAGLDFEASLARALREAGD